MGSENAGLFVIGVGGYWMSRLNLAISPWQIVWPRVVFIMGLSTIFAPLNVAAFLYIPPQLRGAAAGLLALMRNEGGSVGTSVAQTIQQRNFRCSDDSAAPRSIPQFAIRRKSRSAQSGGEFLPRSSPARFSSANRRSGRGETNGTTKPREFARTTSIGSFVLRPLFHFCCNRRGTRRSRFLHETLGRSKRRSCGGRMKYRARAIVNMRNLIYLERS